MRSVRGSPKGWHNLRAKSNRSPKKKRKTFACYRISRKENLESLGYKSYKDYLTSPEWKSIRNIVLERYPDCLLCGKPATQVHHLSYDPITLCGGSFRKLVQLCSSCHGSIEIDKEGNKRTLVNANTELFVKALTGWERSKSWANCTLGNKWFKICRRRLREKGLVK